jgi:hypothetical protein
MRNTLEVGHPEDVTAAVAATAAVILAMRDQPRPSAIALGLAVGSKEWALIAVLPVMLALPHRRLEVAGIAAGLAMLLVGLPWLADPAAAGRALHAQRTNYLGPLSPMWPVAIPIRMLRGGYVPAARMIPWGLMRTGAAALQLGVAVLAGGAWYLSLRLRGLRCNPLCLLAMLAAVRCICDTAGQEYYWLALLIPVAAWECLENRPPIGAFLVVIDDPLRIGGPDRGGSARLSGSTRGGSEPGARRAQGRAAARRPGGLRGGGHPTLPAQY